MKILVFSLSVYRIFFTLVVAAAVGHFEDFELSVDYSKHTPPAEHDETNKQTFVQMSIVIFDILQVNEIDNEMMLDISIFRYWKEPRMEFDANSMKPGKSYPLDPEDGTRFWTPDFYVKRMRHHKMEQEFSHMMLQSDKTLIQALRMDLLMKCNFDFEMFPLDIQECNLDFVSTLHSAEEMALSWKKGNKSSVNFWNVNNQTQMSLYHYNADIIVCEHNFTSRMPWGTVSTVRFWLVLKRNIKSYILDTYLPTTLFVIMSWGSFLVKPDIVPGRMVLLVTNILSLVTFFEAVRRTAPPSTNINGIDVWLLSCILFVFLALLEYAFILFSVLYTKRISAKGQNLNLKLFHVAELPSQSALPDSLTCSQEWCKRLWRKVSLMKALKPVGNWNSLDRLSLIVFPLIFILYNAFYWTIYCSKGQQRNKSYFCPTNSN